MGQFIQVVNRTDAFPFFRPTNRNAHTHHSCVPGADLMGNLVGKGGVGNGGADVPHALLERHATGTGRRRRVKDHVPKSGNGSKGKKKKKKKYEIGRGPNDAAISHCVKASDQRARATHPRYGYGAGYPS